ncbi:uncharacterized protein LOC132982286 [Labrus mixtus]|uniref:uncharacterized protein LOC132982286 n=1 Tax=Labrus mixtus TaxID=508554 RepID=UPI0029BFEB91|nr:uncharacterized protein LOC132982286 [Labrus mixtus]
MVQRQLFSTDHLMNSQFGRPFPRHGLQLLFWFAKDCVICELVQCVVIMKLVSDCHPEKGCFGFHLFGNVEELLPVLDRRRKHKKQVAYYEVGNLNTETYPASEDLPAYVTENYGINGDYNTDRIIIGYQVRSRVVETIYITKHNRAFSGSFSPDDTYEISSELIRALQSPHMDLPSFLTQMGFYQDIPVVKYCDADVIHEQTEQLFDIFDTFAGFKETTQQSDAFGFFSETFNQKLFNNVKTFSHEQRVHHNVNVSSHNNRPFSYSDVQHDGRTLKASKRPRAAWQSNVLSGLEKCYKGFDEEDEKKSRGGGISLVKILLGAGALLLAVRCVSWLRSCSQVNVHNRISLTPPSYRHEYLILDYVY